VTHEKPDHEHVADSRGKGTGDLASTEPPAAGRRPLLAWLLPLLLLAMVGVGVWWFVLRDTTSKQVNRLVAEARAAFELFEYTRAEQLLLQAQSMIPPGAKGSGMNVGVHHNLGILYRRQERWDEARKALVQAAALCGPEANEVRAEELFQVAQIDLHTGKAPAAAPVLEAAIKAHPTRNDLHLSLIDLQLGYLRQPAVADSCLQRFLRLCGKKPENFRDAAGIYFKRRFLNDSLLLARAATQGSDTMVTAHVLVGKSLWRMGRSDEGLEYVAGPLARYPNAVPLWTVQASLFIGAKRFDDALESVDHAVSLSPNDYDANLVRMMVLYNAHRWQEALEQADACLRLTKNSNEIHFLQSMRARIDRGREGKLDPHSFGQEGAPESEQP